MELSTDNPPQKSPPYLLQVSHPVRATMLGKTIRLGLKSLVNVHEPGFTYEATQRVAILEIDIEGHHKGILFLSETALESLGAGGQVTIDTFQSHIRKLKNGSKRKK